MAKHLQNELEKLKRKLITLSSVIEESVVKSVRSVGNKDFDLAQEVIDHDHTIDLIEVEVEEECLKILALYQPVAVDLRYVIAVLKINNDLERIGDLAVNIAEQSIYMGKQRNIKIPFDFDSMSQKTLAMLKKALDSLVQFDTSLAHQTCLDDDEVDAINREMYGKVYAGIKKDPNHVECFIRYLSISRHLERIADYATNIAEDVIYMIDGTIVRHKPEIFHHSNSLESME
ncbi:MAG: phosphate transport system regulatory protein PhoU [Epsilonproteobacteria bacterium]|nr:MAG: phosphate transport system regulatory protein PhoU [Campylobacterota bacterium]RLA67823.1 MAG: phosphate transport system regulatory protein PhoU [Campylobacterota bacterium]